ncbi:hypothetical protein [Xanthomonas euvesicatoria]|uniref:hypothetical protein n=1 Tax=Xanthomonas euvesicatoria TaxID=456327 RepID=UPI001116AD76|nr:hypothetical protein [Xanthomonas euvesicatoria]MBV6778418.1 hypothetical protein [Xanthomonas campestris pv. carissae]
MTSQLIDEVLLFYMTIQYISARTEFDPYYNFWFVQVLVAKGGSPPSWRRHHPNDTPDIPAQAFLTPDDAQERAHELNKFFDQKLANEPDAERRLSLQLRAQKARQSQQRLQQEEELMLTIAQARGRSEVPMAILPARLHPDGEPHRGEIEAALSQYPYIRSIALGERLRRHLVERLKDGSWSKPFLANRKGLKGAHRAPIANGFGLNEFDHYGRTKAAIRQMLLPEASRILTMRGVQQLLADALTRGKRAVVWGSYVFWYEQGGIGWQVKERSGSTDSEDDEAIWFEGKIHSANFGRIVVLPYIKSNGERVRGHTKNAPHDGPAKPRAPGEELVLEFEQLDGDLMRGLLGDFRYEKGFG